MTRLGGELRAGDALEEAVEGSHDLIPDVIAQLRQHLQEPSFWQRGLRKRYLAGEVQLEVRIRGRGEDGDWGAVLHRTNVPHLLEKNLSEVRAAVWPRTDADIFDCVCREVQSAVLVDPVKFVDDPQGVFGEGGATVIRLYALDGFHGIRVRPLQLVQTAAWRGFPGFLLDAVEDVPTLVVADFQGEDGEFRRLLHRFREGTWTLMRDREFEREVIEGRAHGMNGIAHDQRELAGRRLGDLGSNDGLSRLGITLGEEAVCASPEPRFLSGVELFYVLARPVQLL